MIDFHPILAAAGSDEAVRVLENTFKLSESTRASWEEVWQYAINSDDSLWSAIVDVAVSLLGIGLIMMALFEGPEVFKNQSWSMLISMFSWPITVSLLIANDASILRFMVFVLKNFGQRLLNEILRIPMNGIALNDSIRQLNLNGGAIARVRQIYSQCDGMVGAQLTECFERAGEEARDIVEGLQGADVAGGVDFSGVLSFLQNIASVALPGAGIAGVAGSAAQGIGQTGTIEGGFSQVLQDSFLPFVETLLYAIQMALVNLMEVALLLTACFAPIALALSLIPIGGRAIVLWTSSFVGILAAQLGYNILVGIMAFMLTNMEGFFETAQTLVFLIFASIFAPWISFKIGSGGGVSLYEGLSRRASQIVDGGTRAVSTVVRAFI